MRKVSFAVLLVVLLGAIMSCASTGTTRGRAESIEAAYPERFEKTVIGMDVNEFKTVWPEATRSGATNTGEIYEFVYYHMYLYAYDYKIYTNFHFENGKLARYESRKGM